MSQLRLAYVNCKIVSRSPSKNARSTRPSSTLSAPWLDDSLPLLVRKAWRMHEQKPHAAALIEKLLDDVIAEIESEAWR